MEHLAHRVAVGWGFHGLGTAGAHLGSRAVRVQPLWGPQSPASERPLTPAPAGCGLACVTAAWSPRSWPGRSSRSSRTPSSRACSTSSSSVSPAPCRPAPRCPLLWGSSDPQDLLSLTWGLGETDNGTKPQPAPACPSAVSHLGWGCPCPQDPQPLPPVTRWFHRAQRSHLPMRSTRPLSLGGRPRQAGCQGQGWAPTTFYGLQAGAFRSVALPIHSCRHRQQAPGQVLVAQLGTGHGGELPCPCPASAPLVLH